MIGNIPPCPETESIPSGVPFQKMKGDIRTRLYRNILRTFEKSYSHNDNIEQKINKIKEEKMFFYDKIKEYLNNR